MTRRTAEQKHARRLQKEFGAEFSYSAILNLVREEGEERARIELTRRSTEASAELAAMKQRGGVTSGAGPK